MELWKKFKQNPLVTTYLKPPIRGVKFLYKNWVGYPLGSAAARRRHQEDLQKTLNLEEGINNLAERWPDIKSYCDANPVFIFSAGWRSGSTLLQRLLMSSGNIIIWGEPYSEAGLIDYLSSPIKTIRAEYPWFASFLEDDTINDSDLVHKHIANLYPNMHYLMAAHISFFETFFEKSAKDRGFGRWGIKEVRLEIEHAIYLNWLFPKAKFIFLYRNPYEAYNSYRKFYWYNRYPDDPVYTPKRFGLHWKSLLEGYLRGYQKVSSILIKYEDLCQDDFDFKALGEFVDLKIDKNVLKTQVGSSIKWKADKIPIAERRILQRVVEPLASKLGYEYPTY